MRKNLWRTASERAWVKTCKALGFDAQEGVVIRFILAIAAVGGLLFWGSDDAGSDELILRGVLSAFIIFMFPVLYVWKFFHESGAAFEETQNQISRQNSEIEALQSSGPNLEGKIETVWVTDDIRENPDEAAVFVMLSIINSGNTPSVAIDFGLFIITDDKEYRVGIVNLENIIVNHGGKSITYKGKDAIFNKTANPIPVGGISQGFLYGLFEKGITKEFGERAFIKVVYKDCKGRRYSYISDPLIVKEIANFFRHMPLIDADVQESPKRKD